MSEDPGEALIRGESESRVEFALAHETDADGRTILLQREEKVPYRAMAIKLAPKPAARLRQEYRRARRMCRALHRWHTGEARDRDGARVEAQLGQTARQNLRLEAVDERERRARLRAIEQFYGLVDYRKAMGTADGRAMPEGAILFLPQLIFGTFIGPIEMTRPRRRTFAREQESLCQLLASMFALSVLSPYPPKSDHDRPSSNPRTLRRSWKADQGKKGGRVFTKGCMDAGRHRTLRLGIEKRGALARTWGEESKIGARRPQYCRTSRKPLLQ